MKDYKFKLKSPFRLFLVNELEINNDKLDEIMNMWDQPYKHYHNINHLFDIIKKLTPYFQEEEVNEDEYMTLLTAALFHDVIYNPRSTRNEEDSIEYYKSTVNQVDQRVVNIILATKFRKEPESKLEGIFWRCDNSVLKSDIKGLLEYEKLIQKEYQFVDYSTYKESRIEFLNSCIGKFDNDYNIRFLINYIENYTLKVGFYPGSFNPLHKGHMDVIRKAEDIFDKVIIGVGANPDKDVELIDKELEELKNKLNNREVVDYGGLTTDIIDQMENSGDVEITLIRGIRNSTDLNYENDQLKFMKEIKGSDIKIMYLPCDDKYNHISSSKIRKLVDSGYSDIAKIYSV
jgi:pantetheine-phosphate adenylyltransferase